MFEMLNFLSSLMFCLICCYMKFSKPFEVNYLYNDSNIYNAKCISVATMPFFSIFNASF